ncbi:DUF6879 family protein [Streptomyces bauhiniae]|uniref:DUF6879 family protein n=1 Tax=Streptomyces bauhiniae TaxID=2340725 RepID=UPI003802DD67
MRWLPRRRTTDLAVPGTDFWVFDRTPALFHHFTGEGQLARLVVASALQAPEPGCAAARN